MHLTLKRIEESGLYEIVQDSHRTIYYLSDLREFLDKEDSLQYSLTTDKNRYLPMLISENEIIVNGTTVAFVYTNPSGLIIFCTKQRMDIIGGYFISKDNGISFIYDYNGQLLAKDKRVEYIVPEGFKLHIHISLTKEVFPFCTNGHLVIVYDSDNYELLQSPGVAIKEVNEDFIFITERHKQYNYYSSAKSTDKPDYNEYNIACYNRNTHQLLYLIKENDVEAYINGKSLVVICSRDNHIGVIDKNKDIIVPMIYDSVDFIYTNSARYFKATKQECFNILSDSGQLLYHAPNGVELCRVSNGYYDARIKAYYYGKRQNEFLLYDDEWNEVAAISGDRVIGFSDDEIVIATGEGTSMRLAHYDRETGLLLYYAFWEYDSVYSVYYGSSEKIIYNTSGLYGLKYDNEIVLEMTYDNIIPFTDQYFLIERDKRFGLVSEKGEEIVPCIYDALSDSPSFPEYPNFTSDDQSIKVIYVKKDGKIGLYHLFSHNILDAVYDKVIVRTNYFITIKEGRYGLLDKLGNSLLPNSYIKIIGPILNERRGNTKNSESFIMRVCVSGNPIIENGKQKYGKYGFPLIQNAQWKYYNLKTQCLSERTYSVAYEFMGNLAAVKFSPIDERFTFISDKDYSPIVDVERDTQKINNYWKLMNTPLTLNYQRHISYEEKWSAYQDELHDDLVKDGLRDAFGLGSEDSVPDDFTPWIG